MTDAKPKRRWFRFSLRTFLIVITLFSVWLGWKVNAAHEQRRAVAAVRPLGLIRYDYELAPNTMALKPLPELDYCSSLLGVDFFHCVAEISFCEESPKKCGDVLRQFGHFPRLRVVLLNEDSLHDEDLRGLENLTGLEYLWLNKNEISGTGFKYLVNSRNLKLLSVADNPVTDESLETISNLPELSDIRLENTNVTDACIESLARLPRLTLVQIFGSHITGDGVRRLKQLRPKLFIMSSVDQSPAISD
jgi:hypothetical protein